MSPHEDEVKYVPPQEVADNVDDNGVEESVLRGVRPTTEVNVVNEFRTDGLGTMVFHVLFPFWKGIVTQLHEQGNMV